mmetsp:Transcript_501/g.1340  ORF Transcript_501/g.1340 Transcript_501/m.1340 type:complete len:1030 (+) Transcript_501:187-3276(+)
MDDDSSIANESINQEPMVVEVEIHDVRGLDQEYDPSSLEEGDDQWYYEASMQLVSSLTGDPIRDCGVQWVRLRRGRRMSFMTPRFTPDRFVFGGVLASSLLAVRFDVFRKRPATAAGDKAACRLIGVAEVTPWIIFDDKIEDATARYCRWVRLVENTARLPGKQRSVDKGTQGLFGGRRQRAGARRAAGSSLSIAAQPSPAARTSHTKRQRSELRVAVTSKIGTGDALADAIAVAEAKSQWFLQPKPAVDPLNVVRIVVIRSSEVLSSNAVVAARLSANIEEVDDPSMFFAEGVGGSATSAPLVAITRPSPYGVWMETLELAVPPKLAHLHRDAFFVDIAIMHRVMTAGRSNGELLLRRAVIPMANVLSDDPCWIDFKPNVSLKLALRWDYDEVYDKRESRPFFDMERFELKPEPEVVVGPGKKKKSKAERKETCNNARIVLARARIPPPTINVAEGRRPSADRSPSRDLVVPGAKFCARVNLSLGGLNGLAPAPQMSTVVTVGADGVIVWNECFEFVFPQESSRGQQTEVRIDLVPLDEPVVGEERPSGLAAILTDIPRNEVSRKWYDVFETAADGTVTDKSAGIQIQVVATRLYDATLNQEDMRSIVTEALSFAFPEVDLRSIERVYDSTKDVADACVALSSLTASTERDSDIESAAFVASCSATDLQWAIQPIAEEKDQDDSDEASNGSPELPPGGDDPHQPLLPAYDPERAREVEARRRAASGGPTAVMLTQGEAVKMIKDTNITDFDVAIVSGSPATAITGEQTNLDSPSTERRTLVLYGGERSKSRPRGRRTTVRVASTLEDTTAKIRSVSLIKMEVSVDRTPRDFVTLREGLVAKLGPRSGEIPALPKWIRMALRLKVRTQRISIASGVTTASVAAAIAIATGVVAPVLILPGAVGVGLAVCSTSAQATKSVLKRELARELSKSTTWLTDVAQALANANAPPDRLRDATLFFKQFVSHSGTCTMSSGLRRQGGGGGGLDEVREEMKDEYDLNSVSQSVDDMTLSSNPSSYGLVAQAPMGPLV